MLPSVAIVIVSYNCREALRQCLARLGAGGAPPRTVVVDNASADGSAEMVRGEFPRVELIGNDRNRGFAAACNQGIRATTEEAVLLLNPDALLDAAALETLRGALQNRPDVGACGPRLLNPDGTLQPSCRRFPRLGVMVCAELGWRGPYQMRGWAHDTTREVDQLMGSCLLLRRAAVEQTGLLDERFFLYFEEVDLCRRLQQAGWRVLFVREAAVIHSGGQSSRTDRRAALEHRYRSLCEYYRKHYPPGHLAVLKCAVLLGALGRVAAGQKDYGMIARKVWRL